MNYKKPLVSIIILNWNGLKDTERCVKSLLNIKGINRRILVVDNGSRKNEADLLKKKFGTKIKVYRLDRNLGFTGGVNFGIARSRAIKPDFYLLLNNDVEVKSDFLEYLIKAAQSDKEIGAISPLIYDFKQREKILFSGGKINWILAKPYHQTDIPKQMRYSLYVTGCCLLIKKDVIDKLSCLDNRFFAYFEDTAFCLSIKKLGYKCVCEPRAIIYHKLSGSSDRRGGVYTNLISRNRILFVKNYLPKIFFVYYAIFFSIKWILAEIYFYLTGQQGRADAYSKGYFDGMRNIGGQPRI